MMVDPSVRSEVVDPSWFVTVVLPSVFVVLPSVFVVLPSAFVVCSILRKPFVTFALSV
jgi:hypothetical protein